MLPNRVLVKCPQCGEEREVSRSNKSAAEKRPCRVCGNKNAWKTKLENGTATVPSNKGMSIPTKGWYISSDGYMMIYTGPKTYEREHRLVVSKDIGRALEPKEVVHHINGDKLDNRIENLCLLSGTKEHQSVHGSLDEVSLSLIKLGLIDFDKDTKKYYVAHQKLRELLEHPEEGNQQPSLGSDI